MTAPLTGPETSAAEQSRMELQARLNGLGGLNGRQLNPEAKAKKLREACEGFESIFIQKMWQEMRNAVPKTGILSGREERFWQDMYDQELSKSMTSAGGIGLADMMYEQLSRNLVSASRSAAGGMGAAAAAFTPGAAPLVREQSVDLLTANQNINSNKLAASIYDGEASETGATPGQQALMEPAHNSGPQATAQAAQPPYAAPLTQTALYDPAPNTAYKDNTAHKIHKADLGQSSGLLNAQKARREAGDKLGSRSVRPAQSKEPTRRPAKKQVAEAAPVEPQITGISQNGNLQPGTAAALQAAMEAAKTGAPANDAAQPIDLNNMVARMQAANFAPQAPAASAQQMTADASKSAEPITRKVTYTTNVPPVSKLGSRSNKKANQAIRMLNVDNVGVNSKAGKGLAAYHAQQEAAQAAQPAANQPVAPLTASQAGEMAQANAPIPPLTPADQRGSDPAPGVNFAIPPLTVADSRR